MLSAEFYDVVLRLGYDWSLQSQRERVDATFFGDPAKAYLAGHREYTLRVADALDDLVLRGDDLVELEARMLKMILR